MKTFDQWLEEQMQDAKFKKAYEEARLEVEEEYDAAIAEEAYKEYVQDGQRSEPIQKLWKDTGV